MVMMVAVHEPFSTYLTYIVESLLMVFHMQLIIISRGELFTTVVLLTDDINFFLKKTPNISLYTKQCITVFYNSQKTVEMCVQMKGKVNIPLLQQL